MKAATLVFLFFTNTVLGQIPNSGFENWTSGIPDNWFSQTGYAYVAQDNNAHSGNFALRFQTVQGSSSVTATTLFTRISSTGSFYPISFSTAPVSVGFYAITNLMNGDLLTINTTLKRGNDIIGVVTGTCVSTVSGTYQLYTFPINYQISGQVPDSAATWFSIRNTTCTPNSNPLNPGTFALIDDLEFDITTGIQEDATVGNLNVYPNPATEKLYVESELDRATDVEIKIFSIEGRRIMSQQFFRNSGTFFLPVDISKMAEGLYFLHLWQGDKLEMRKFVVEH